MTMSGSNPPATPAPAATLSTFSWAVRLVMGPTLEVVGEDVRHTYQAAKEKVFAKALTKGVIEGDSKSANPRIVIETLRSGCLTENEVCAEYFGGILAASRSHDGKDDSAMPFLEIIKSLSSRQLHLHYCIYSSLNKLIANSNRSYFPVERKEFRGARITFKFDDLAALGLMPVQDAPILEHVGLIDSYEYFAPRDDPRTEAEIEPTGAITFRPTQHGIMLYAVSLGDLRRWRKFGTGHFEDFNQVSLPPRYFESSAAAYHNVTYNSSIPPISPFDTHPPA